MQWMELATANLHLKLLKFKLKQNNMKFSTFIKGKKLFSFSLAALFAMGAAIPVRAATADEEVATLDPRLSRLEYKPGEVIVKFKDSPNFSISRKNGKFQSASITAVDKLLRSIGAEDVEPLMPMSGATAVGKRMKAYNGTEIVAKDLSRLYVVKIKQSEAEPMNLFEIINQFNSLEEVEFAEPNYIMHTLETSPGITDTPDDPMYELQYGISAINLDKLWPMPVISKEGPVIAILDTGVELTHPDLQDNLWTNEKEAEGSDGYDDDGNGFKDDIHGWDFINNTGEIYDYNGHGTHCAGIAAASGFNGKGIVGANPDARIMPVTVMQSNGTGDIATIIKGVDYATANGAKIISMSLGSYSTSIALEEALGRAYQNAIIVAAAGNDKWPIDIKPCFPAAYQFVIGVQSVSKNGVKSGFSNFDGDPIYSPYPDNQLYNYEIWAPGESIVSTYPGGTYKSLNGTSMSTPLVSGALSRLLQSKEYNSWELLFGDLIHTASSDGVLNIFATYKVEDKDRIPEIQIVHIDIEDENKDGRPDAGEWIEFYPTIRNTWGNVSNVKFAIESNELVNNVFDIEIAEGELGHSLSTYGKARAEKPVKIKLFKDVADGRILVLKLKVYGDNFDSVEQIFELQIDNAVNLTGLITEDLTLSPDNHYVVTETFGIPSGKTLRILPGTKIKFRDNSQIKSNGEVIALGNPENPIIFTMADNDPGFVKSLSFGSNSTFEYCIFENLKSNNNNYDSNDGIKLGQASHCIFRNLEFKYTFECTQITRSSIYNIESHAWFIGGTINNCNVHKINHYTSWFVGKPINSGIWASSSSQNGFHNSNIFNNSYWGSDDNRDSFSFDLSLVSLGDLENVKPEFPNYLGTSSLEIAKNNVIDILNPNNIYLHTTSQYDFSNTPWKPFEEAPGIVWKVEVNGKDAQDEFDQISPLGVGKQEFKVYFNRPMNKKVAPSISMGVRPPYTQTAIAEEGEWNDDGDIYTAYLTISGKADYDGLNRIYVAGAEDNEFFPIPIENSRFNVYVSAAGSMSNGFMATPGLGKVELEWEASDKEIDDVLGYNIYRYTVNEEGTPSDTLQLNQRLIDVTEFTDYDVVPGTTYHYYYKTLRTNMSENSPSKVVAATPLTASKGDANGSMKVDVADVVTEVSYITGGNPQPFIFEAADVNADEEINILDIVGTINIINTPTGASTNAAEELSTAYFSVENGTLYVDCDQPIGGVQVRLNADRAKTAISKVTDFSGFEEVANWLSDNEYLYMAFSMSGRTIAPGKHALLDISDAQITEIVASNVEGINLPVELSNASTAVERVETTSDFRAYPNPAIDIVNLDYVVPMDTKVFFVVSNLQGALVDTASTFSPAGKNTVTVNVGNLPEGVYFIQAIVNGKNLNTYKVIKK